MIFDIVDFTVDATAFRHSKPAKPGKMHKKSKPRIAVSIGMVVHRRMGGMPPPMNGQVYRFPFGDFMATEIDGLNSFITFKSVYSTLTLKNFSLSIVNGAVEGVLIAMTYSEGSTI